MTKKEQRNYNIVWETYELLYKASTPSVDFNELVKNSLYENKEGKIQQDIKAGSLSEEEMKIRGLRHYIPFEDYHIDKDLAISIVNDQAKKYKLTKFEKEGLNSNIWLGCSPCFTKNN